MGLSKTRWVQIYIAQPMRAEQSWVLFQWPDRHSGEVKHTIMYPRLSTSLFYRDTVPR